MNSKMAFATFAGNRQHQQRRGYLSVQGTVVLTNTGTDSCPWLLLHCTGTGFAEGQQPYLRRYPRLRHPDTAYPLKPPHPLQLWGSESLSQALGVTGIGSRRP